jgi:threonine dehydratase
MPRTAPQPKKNAVRSYGAEITFCEPTLESREETLDKIVAETGAVFIHPYNNLNVIRGASTACLELVDDYPDLDLVVAPVGGGGLLSGTSLAATLSNPKIKVFGAEPAGADDAYRSLKENKILPSISPNTIADGLLTSLGNITFEIIRSRVDKILTVSDQNIIKAMKLIWERMKIVVEPSGAVPLAALMEHNDLIRGKRIGLILSGGNIDLDHLPW